MILEQKDVDIEKFNAPAIMVAGLADAMDLRSIGGKALRVQAPPAPLVNWVDY